MTGQAAADPDARLAVLVEGESDRIAVEVLARRRGLDLASDGVRVLAMGGITNVRAFALRLGPRGDGLPLAGLYDAPEAAVVRRGLVAAGVTTPGSTDLAAHGFFACEADLEAELIRALGVDRVEAVVETEGDGRSLRLLAGMPAQRSWSRERVLHRFLGAGSGRKARYAELLVTALAPGEEPPPLRALLDCARRHG